MIESIKFITDAQFDAAYYAGMGPGSDHRAGLRAAGEMAIAAYIASQAPAVADSLDRIATAIESLRPQPPMT